MGNNQEQQDNQPELIPDREALQHPHRQASTLRTISRSDSIKVITEWLRLAAKKKLHPHPAEFWVILDILEGDLKVPRARAEQATAFFRENTKSSDEKQLILSELEKEGL